MSRYRRWPFLEGSRAALLGFPLKGGESEEFLKGYHLRKRQDLRQRFLAGDIEYLSEEDLVHWSHKTSQLSQLQVPTSMVAEPEETEDDESAETEGI